MADPYPLQRVCSWGNRARCSVLQIFLPLQPAQLLQQRNKPRKQAFAEMQHLLGG